MSGTVNGTGVAMENDLSGVGSLSETIAERQGFAAFGCDFEDSDAIVCSLIGGYTAENDDAWTIGAYFYHRDDSLKLLVIVSLVEFSDLGEEAAYKSDEITISAGKKTNCDEIAESGSATQCAGTVGPGSVGWSIAVA